mgnify:FL=1
MWIFTNDGFFSIAQHYTEMDCFQVKSRVPDVLEKLWPESEIEIIEDADYRYRITIEKEKVIPVIIQKMETVDYSNFKNECHNMEDYYRALGGVWSKMYEYQKRVEKS